VTNYEQAPAIHEALNSPFAVRPRLVLAHELAMPSWWIRCRPSGSSEPIRGEEVVNRDEAPAIQAAHNSPFVVSVKLVLAHELATPISVDEMEPGGTANTGTGSAGTARYPALWSRKTH